MKKRFALLLAVLLCVFVTRAQQTDSIPLNKDSIEKAVDDFLAMLDSAKQPTSYWQLSLGVSNTQFSVTNKALNAQQVTSNFSLLPTVSYYDKSGLSITYTGFLALAGNNTGFVQHAITPAYDFSKDKNFDFGVSYTRFIGNDKFAESTSPYKNDFYSYLQYNRWKIQPSIALGYSTGKFASFSRTDTFLILQRPVRPDTTINYSIFDTLNVKLRDFTTVLSAQRQWIFDGKYAANYITFTPSVLLFLAKNSYDVEYTSVSAFSPRTRQFLQNNPVLRDRIIQELRSKYPGLNQTRTFLESTPFSLQSIGINFDAVFYINKFYINPQCYFDYYLKGSTDKLSVLYSLQVGFIL
jgi:hypothetical protein